MNFSVLHHKTTKLGSQRITIKSSKVSRSPPPLSAKSPIRSSSTAIKNVSIVDHCLKIALILIQVVRLKAQIQCNI